MQKFPKCAPSVGKSRLLFTPLTMRKADQEVSPLVDEAMHLYIPESLGSKSARETKKLHI